MADNFVTKDSGKREEFDSGMVRDTEEGKARFDLLFPLDIPYAEQMLTRAADLMERGMAKYGERNWEKANSKEERDRARSSAARHMIQWLAGETDEDHAAAVIFNLIAAETISYKITPQLVLSEWHPRPKIPQKKLEPIYERPAPICGAQCWVGSEHPCCNLPVGHVLSHYHIGSGKIGELYWD